MTDQESKQVALVRHLQSTANAAKNFTLAQFAKVSAGGGSSANFTGATSITGGSNGLVPAPQAGEENYFLSGNGTWAPPTDTTYSVASTTQAGLMSAADKIKLDGLETYTLPTASTSVKGGVVIGGGLSMIGDTLNVTISGGDNYSVFTGATSIAGGTNGLVPAPGAGAENYFLRGDGSWASVSSGGSNVIVSGGNVLSTVASTINGGLWYDISGDSPALKLHHGNYDYSFNYDSLHFVGDASNSLVAYLPFTSSPTLDTCGNTWTATGTPTLSTAQTKFADKSLYLDGSSYLAMTDGVSLGGQDFTIDCWAYIISGNYGRIFEISINETNGAGYTRWICETNSGYFDANISGASGGNSQYSSRNAWHHCALVYSHSNQTTCAFIDGQLLASKVENIPRALFGQIFISQCNYFNGGGRIQGYINHFRIFDGVACWLSEFTPPTASDYL